MDPDLTVLKHRLDKILELGTLLPPKEQETLTTWVNYTEAELDEATDKFLAAQQRWTDRQFRKLEPYVDQILLAAKSK